MTCITFFTNSVAIATRQFNQATRREPCTRTEAVSREPRTLRLSWVVVTTTPAGDGFA